MDPGPSPRPRELHVSPRARRVTAVVAGVALLVAGVIVLAQALRTTPCDNVHFRSAQAPAAPSAEPPPIGENRLVHGLHQFLRGASPAVYCDDFPDPFVLRVAGSYYAYSTQSSGYHVPVLATHGLLGSGGRREALPTLPSWSAPGWVWAPSVLPLDGKYLLYYATRSSALGRQCLSSAVASKPVGPFVDGSTGPLLCTPSGAYDPSPIADASGHLSLLFSNGSSILSQPLAGDGRTPVGPPATLLRADQGWEAGVVEGPSMVGDAGRFYLFFSANQWLSASYAIGYAVCASPVGPCAEAPGPWLSAGGDVAGPGGQEFFTDPSGRLWMSLHAWLRGHVGYPDGARNLFALPITFRSGVPETG